MKIGVLTSSRADFGIYLPLLRKLYKDPFFEPEIIAFGTHLSNKFGNTIQNILDEGFDVKHQLETVPSGDSPQEIALSIGKTIGAFSDFWNKNKFDLVLALGDRFEMLGAVVAGSPFNVPFGHIHSGETTLGAIDNAYRHSISLMSKYLFVTTEEYKERAVEILKQNDAVFNVGALSIDNLTNEKLLSIEEFNEQFRIDLNIPTILTTFHPETIGYEKNEVYIKEAVGALNVLSTRYQIVVTMPNADTAGLIIRNQLIQLGDSNKKIILVESLGMKGYLSCMKHCQFMLGNTSSGFVEAAFFPKWVINLGNRQLGRIITPNIKTTPINKDAILEAASAIENSLKTPPESNIYGDGNAAEKIINSIKEIFERNG